MAVGISGYFLRPYQDPKAAMIRFYAKRLDRDLKRWLEKGWLTEEGYQAILAEQAEGTKIPASAALAAVGAVLLGFAAISFVAANWAEIPRLYRVAILTAALWAAYASAAYLYKRGLPGFAQAAVLAGALFFGACVMLVSQMYHIGHERLPDLILLWVLGAGAAGILFRSSLTLACAMVLAGVWFYVETGFVPREVHWHFLPVWAALAGAIAWNRSGIGLHIAAAVLTVWIVRAGIVSPSHPYTIVAAMGAAAVLACSGVMAAAESMLARQIAVRAIPYAMIVSFGGLLPQDPLSNAPLVEAALAIAAGIALAALMLSRANTHLQQALPILFAYALCVSFYGLCNIQFFRQIQLGTMVMAAALTFAILAGALICGIQIRSRLVMWLAYAGLVAEILTLYFEKLGTLINTSLFFLVTGTAIFALASVLMRYGGAPRETEARS